VKGGPTINVPENDFGMDLNGSDADNAAITWKGQRRYFWV